jgi:hypothetical protein
MKVEIDEYPMDLLKWKEITTERQKKNGTRIFQLPIKQYGQFIEVGSFESGYVRRMNGCYTPYQLNKCEPIDHYYKDYKHSWDEKTGDHKQFWTGKYNKYVGKSRILIDNEEDRLKYLITYCLKNYYINQANMIEDGKFVPKWKYENMKNRFEETAMELSDRYTWSNGEVTDNKSGEKYVHEQHAYWNHRNDGALDNLSVIVNNERYKII